VKFRRSSRADEAVDEASSEPAAQPATDPRTGPFDADDVADDGLDRVDLGSLLIPPSEGRELRLQVDERSQQVQSVVLAGSDGALELRAFAAPRHGDLWSDVRPQLAADMARRGGTATEQEGRFGVELACRLTVKAPDGRTGEQPSRIVGVNGSRWMLRATFLGQPAVDAESARDWEDALAAVAVRRGDQAMPVGDPLPLVLPEQARRVTPPGASDADATP